MDHIKSHIEDPCIEMTATLNGFVELTETEIDAVSGGNMPQVINEPRG